MLRIGLSAFASLALAGPLLAQSDDEPIVLPPWTVEERADHQTARAHTDSFASTLGATSVVSDRAWAGRSLGTLSEALRRAPGVVLQESFGGFEPPRLSIRGSGLDSAPSSRGVALLIDGLPLSRADGSFHSGIFDPQLFSRVEIYRGTVHAGLTPAVLGGVVNAVSLPTNPANGASATIEAGSFDAQRARFSSTDNVSGSILHTAASYARQDGWRDHSAQERTTFAANVRHRFSTATTLDVSTYLARPKYEVPGPLTLRESELRPRSVSAAVLRDRPRRDASLVRAAAQLKHTLSDGVVATGFAAQRLHDDFRQLIANGESDSVSDDLSGHGTWSQRVTFGGQEHHLLARLVASTGTNSVERFLNNRGERGARFAEVELNATTTALNLEDIVWLHPKFAVGLGATVLWARREIDDQLKPAGTTGSASRTLNFDAISPRIGVHWNPRTDLSFSASVSHGVEPPTFDDLLVVQGASPNLTLRSRELEAQRATTAEIGAHGRRGPLTWNVAVYHSRWRDEILKLADDAGLPRGAVNAERTTHEGVEVALRYRLLDGDHKLTASATGTWNRFHFDDDPVFGDNRIAGAPPHVGNAELLYEHPRSVFVAGEATWVAGDTPVDHASRLGYGGHTLYHARLGWRINERVTVFAAGRNLFDRNHIASTAGVLDIARAGAATMIFLPGNARSLSLGLEWKL